MNQRMNEPIFVPLLFATLSLLDSFFPSGLLLRKNPSARLCMLSFHVTSQVSRYLDGSFQLPLSPETDIWKKKLRPNSNILHIFLKSFCISLPLNAKKSLLQHLFFAKHTYLLELHLELSSGSSLHLYRSLSLFYTRCAPFRVWKYSQALLPPYGITAHHFLPFRVPAKK